MKISRDERKHGNLLPAACGKLSLIPDRLLFHQKHLIRHPDSTYAISLQKFLYSLISVLDQIDAIKDKPPSIVQPNMEGVLWHYESFLRAAQEQFESHYQVLRSLIDPSKSAAKSRFADRYVEENRLPGERSFSSAVQSYKNRLNCVNHLKHNQTVLRFIAAEGPPAVDGFFFEEVDANGVLGPSPVVHPDNGAFSFNRHLFLYVYYVYFCSEKLTKAIDAVLEFNKEPKFGTASKTQSSLVMSEAWKKAMLRVGQMPAVCFPKEMTSEMPVLKLSDDTMSMSITLKSSIHIQWPNEFKVTFGHQIDGHHLKLKRPEI